MTAHRNCRYCHDPIPQKKLGHGAKYCTVRCKNLDERQVKRPERLRQCRPSYDRMMKGYNRMDAGYAHPCYETDFPSIAIPKK
jgi:hypothetical protein